MLNSSNFVNSASRYFVNAYLVNIFVARPHFSTMRLMLELRQPGIDDKINS